MHFKRFTAASKFLLGLGTAASLALLSGCATMTLTNLTPPSLPDNPSEIYTFTLRVTPKIHNIDEKSITPRIVVDGQSYPMVQSSLGDGIYEFDYQLPPGRTEVAYYYLVDYRVEGADETTGDEAYTGISQAQIVRRYVLSLEANRGPVGARIGVLGRGFTAQDTVSLGDTPARTVFESPTSLSFFVPALQPGNNYSVTLNSPAGNSPVGTFRVDPVNVTIDPSTLTIASGGQQPVTFTISTPAPPGGLLLDVTTDVPESVIMPEVVVPEGATSATVTVQGGRPGSGSLILKGYGEGQVTVPITVSGK
jgi:hypothetical protein